MANEPTDTLIAGLVLCLLFVVIAWALWHYSQWPGHIPAVRLRHA